MDTSGYVPRLVRESAELLAGAVERYVFVSSISVYAGFSEPVTETSPLAAVEDETTEDVQEHYGALKALCERAVEDVYGDRATSVRAGLIVGPHDPTGRFTYWPHRIARGGEVLVPGHPDRPVQFVDVRDLAGFLLLVAERGPGGPVTATGPVPALTMGALAEACRAASGSDATFTYVDEAFLAEHEVGEWMELPLWVAPKPGWERFLEADVSRALAAGLTFRPLADTVRDTLAQAARVDGVGLAPGREAELLRRRSGWRPRSGRCRRSSRRGTTTRAAGRRRRAGRPRGRNRRERRGRRRKRRASAREMEDRRRAAAVTGATIALSRAERQEQRG